MNQKPKPRVPTRENKSIPTSQNLPSSSAPDGYSEVAVLLKAMKEKKHRCFGGWIVHSTDHAGFPVVSHAIRTSLIRDASTEMSRWYHWTTANGAGIFPAYAYSVSAGDYTFFRFALSEGAISMREMMKNPEREGLCRNLFTDLVMLLHRYGQKCEKSAGKYRPLCCISLDTVFMDPSGQVSILPLLCVNDEYPRGFPLEAGSEEMDDSSDLFTAALLTYQVLSGCEYEKCSEHKQMRVLKNPANMVDCMNQSLKLFASQRSSLREVYAQLTKEKTPPAEESRPSGKNPRRTRDTRDYREPRCEEQPEAGFWIAMRSLREKMSSVFNMESDMETSRTAGRPKAEPKWTGRKWGLGIGDDYVDYDDYDDFEDDIEDDYEDRRNGENDYDYDYDESDGAVYDEEP